MVSAVGPPASPPGPPLLKPRAYSLTAFISSPLPKSKPAPDSPSPILAPFSPARLSSRVSRADPPSAKLRRFSSLSLAICSSTASSVTLLAGRPVFSTIFSLAFSLSSLATSLSEGSGSVTGTSGRFAAASFIL